MKQILNFNFPEVPTDKGIHPVEVPEELLEMAKEAAFFKIKGSWHKMADLWLTNDIRPVWREDIRWDILRAAINYSDALARTFSVTYAVKEPILAYILSNFAKPA